MNTTIQADIYESILKRKWIFIYLVAGQCTNFSGDSDNKLDRKATKLHSQLPKSQ